MSISPEFLELAETESLKTLIRQRIDGGRRRARGQRTSYSVEETTKDVFAMAWELYRREVRKRFPPPPAPAAA